MVIFAYIVGIYAYSLFLLGIAGFLYRPVVIFMTLCVLGVGIWYAYKYFMRHYKNIFRPRRLSGLAILLLSFLILQVLINGIGVLGPELGFDALWYHLTFPKLYLSTHTIAHMQGGVFYYSDLPKFLELLYTGALALLGTTGPKLLHFSLGLASLYIIYKIAREFLPQEYALLASAIFYTNLVVGWESISAYVDLGRAFFELLSAFTLLRWVKEANKRLFILSALFMGFAVSVKLIAVGSLFLFALFIFLFLYQKNRQRGGALKRSISFVVIALLVPFPWFIFSVLNTGNPVYPLFTHAYPINNYLQVFNPLFAVWSLWTLFTSSPDPISPVYIAFLPLLILCWKVLREKMPYVLYLGIGGVFVWYFTPQTGGGRFIIPYLPYLSILCAGIVYIFHGQKQWKQILLLFILITAFISIGYRGFANAKFIPYILGQETQAQFLQKHLNFSFGDFYDIDGYFAKHIKPTDRVLLYGFHNLYYVDFPFIEASSAQKGERFTYVAVQGNGVPERFRYWNLIYFNSITNVRVYSLSNTVWYY